MLLASPAVRADTYTYDVFGNLSTVSSDRGTRSFTYDEIDRLKTETGFTGTRAHAYDANTNRTSDGATPPTLITYTPATNRIATANGLTVTHDAAGNLLADGLYTYTWDEAGRLKTVSKNGTLLATYAYDYRNRRSSKSTTAAAPQGAQAILYHYDQDDHLIGETRSDGTPLRTYIWLAERPITIIEHAAISNPPRSLHLQHDHLGTPRLAKNDAGVIQWRWDSDGYGTSMPTQDPDGDGKATVINLRFPGQYYDQESGLYYNWNRYYSPRLGRYVSPDPIGIEGGGNGYGYVRANPLRYSDPLGLDPWDWDGPGDTGVCGYYDEMYEKTKCDYYKTAGQICRGKRSDVNTFMRIGIAQSWASGRTTASESEILTKVRNSLVSYDRTARSLGPTEACGCPKGDSIDLYHDLAFSNAGISPAFYGGNLWPQGVWPNPVPYDPTGNSSLDPRRLFK